MRYVVALEAAVHGGPGDAEQFGKVGDGVLAAGAGTKFSQSQLGHFRLT
jgi:hypothetical protein